ncbi:hypothetical protein JCM8097_009063 [Rhodosporidiobolus ruineniae]
MSTLPLHNSNPPSPTSPTSATVFNPPNNADLGGTAAAQTRGGGGAGSGRGWTRWYRREPMRAPTRLVVKNHFIAFIGEFVGTATFLFFALGATTVANIPATSIAGTEGGVAAPNTSNLLYISLAFGFSLAVTVWIFFRISGGLFNPQATFPCFPQVQNANNLSSAT